MKLGDSYQTAFKRFLSLERSLNKNENRKTQYTEFLQEYERLGHMTEVTSTDEHSGYYLPHHAVMKSDSITTKVRVVFDASARTSSGTSLNDILMVGPTIQDDLFTIVTRFRTHKYVLTADITKMYRQVELHPEDRKYHQILWRTTSNDPIKTYQLNTVTYGTASAPYLAIRTLHQLARDEVTTDPIAARILAKDFYVDDVLTGANSFAEAIRIRDSLIKLTSKGGFQLRQWVSNEPKLIHALDSSKNSEHITLNITDDKKTLGLYWKAGPDTLIYHVKNVEPLSRVTKRTILSRIAQLFDPLGLLGPIIVQAKLIMQGLWKCKLDWDESVPLDIHTAWTTLQSQLHVIQKLKIPRRVLGENYTHLELHGFCDASERAYGACIYIRSSDSKQSHRVHLLCSKSRIAPLKTQSLPRLELCAAVLLTKLYSSVNKALEIPFNRVMFWSDSMITLHWINTEPHRLKQFVANRVSEIQRTVNIAQWRHVPSEHNPADLLSRGSNPTDFLNQHIWELGPEWLSQSDDTWPQYTMQPIEIPEKRKTVVLQASIPVKCDFLNRYSSLTILMRVIAQCLRFTHNTRNQVKRTGALTIEELQEAHIRIIKAVQLEAFPKEIHKISNQTHRSRFTALSPFMDTNGLIRVGGRLKHSNLPYESKYPLVIPQRHHITEVIIREYHLRNGHSGMQATLYALREKYWPINGKEAIKAVIRHCITCQKLKPFTPQYPMGNLPENRVRPSRPFMVTGVDYCGPFYIKEKRHRNTKKLKTYAAVFVCFCTKAVHIELVSDLTSDAFLAALKRFFARRGKSSHIYSDNATNFVGAHRELQEIKGLLSSQQHNKILTQYLTNQGVRWHFIPPRAPHFGGLWEAAVRSLKHHLTRIVGNTLFTFEQLTTCLTEIEAILNSRPITPMSSDPNDLTSLTPGHFLIGDSITSTPECDLTSLKPGRLSAWQHVQQVRQHFWSRWYKEYLNELTVKKKWHDNPLTNIKVGALVLLKEDNTPPLCWPMGRIVAVHPGDDHVIRVVTIKTIKGEYKRSINKVAPLPIDHIIDTATQPND